MKALLKIAWRNLFRHRGRSIVIGTILFLGAMLMIVGNGVINGLDEGIQKSIVDRFLGNAVVLPADYSQDNIITGMPKPMPILQDFSKLTNTLYSTGIVKKMLPMGRGGAVIFNGSDRMNFMMLIGSDFEDYQKMFHSNVVVVEGRLLTNGEQGLLITEDIRKRQYEITGEWIVPKGVSLNVSNLTKEALANKDKLKTRSELVIMGNGGAQTGTDIRIPVVGIIKYSTMNSMWGMINLIDIDSFRNCFGYLSSDEISVSLDKEDQKLLNSDEKDLDSLFSESDFVVKAQNLKSSKPSQNKKKAVQHKAQKHSISATSYNLITLKFNKGLDPEETIVKLNQTLKGKGLKVRVVSWQAASGQLAQFADILRTVLFVFVLFIFFVAMIVIMNTLAMSAVERTAEIATMRAIGARRSFLSRMFLSETFLLSFFFGGLGILTGMLIIWIISLLKIQAGNQIAALIFGGDVFHPTISWIGIQQGIIQLLIVTFLSVIYPIRVVRRIVPLQAIERE